MADREEKRTARNRNLFTRMAATPTKAQILAEIDLEISDAINLAAAADFPGAFRRINGRVADCHNANRSPHGPPRPEHRRQGAHSPRSCAGCSPCPYHRRVASRRHNKPERYRRGTRRASRSDDGQPTLAPGTSLAAVEAAGGVAGWRGSRVGGVGDVKRLAEQGFVTAREPSSAYGFLTTTRWRSGHASAVQGASRLVRFQARVSKPPPAINVPMWGAVTSHGAGARPVRPYTQPRSPAAMPIHPPQ